MADSKQDHDMDDEVPPTERLTKGQDGAQQPTVAYAGGKHGDGGGDARIDIQPSPGKGAGNGGPATGGSGLVGMTKKELMRYANDPFWIRLRRGLFVLFWIVWFGMLLASVFIIYDAINNGGCTGKDAPVTASPPEDGVPADPQFSTAAPSP